MKITLATLNGRGAVAGIESNDALFGGELDIAGDEFDTPAMACRKAAAALRLAARRFEILADSTAPLRASMQDAVNELPESAL